MIYSTLDFQKIDGVMIFKMIRIDNDPETKGRLADELTEFCAEIVSDEKIKVVVLTGGEESSFSIETGLGKEFSKDNAKGTEKNVVSH